MQNYTDEVKAQVIARWESGDSLNVLTGAFGIAKSTIQGWVKGRPRTSLVPKPKQPDEDTIDDIAWSWLKAQGDASLAILRKAADDSWLSRQNAHDLGVLYGIIADKQLRLLAAWNPREPARDGA